MLLALLGDEIGVTTTALALHIGDGTEDDESEDFIAAAEIISSIAEARVLQLPDEIIVELSSTQAETLLCSLSYAYSFYTAYKEEELESVRVVIEKLADPESLKDFDDWLSKANRIRL